MNSEQLHMQMRTQKHVGFVQLSSRRGTLGVRQPPALILICMYGGALGLPAGKGGLPAWAHRGVGRGAGGGLSVGRLRGWSEARASAVKLGRRGGGIARPSGDKG